MDFPFIVPDNDFSEPSGLPRTAWDTVQLGQFTLPGISRVDVSRERKASIKTPKGKSFSTIKDSGLELAKITITNTIAYQSQLDALEQVLRYFNTQLGVKVKSTTTKTVNKPSLQQAGTQIVTRGTTTTATSTSLTNVKTQTIPLVSNEEFNAGTKTVTTTSFNGFAVNHPALQMHDIKTVFIQNISGPIPSRPGFITTVFTCIEVREPKDTTGGTGASKVKPSQDFAQGSALVSNSSPPPPSQNPAATGP